MMWLTAKLQSRAAVVRLYGVAGIVAGLFVSRLLPGLVTAMLDFVNDPISASVKMYYSDHYTTLLVNKHIIGEPSL